MTNEEYTAGLLASSAYRDSIYWTLSRNRFSEYERRLARAPLRLLEIGCGAGGMAEEFARLGVQYRGIDIDKRAVSAAVKRGLLNVHVADFLELPDEEPYDVIVASQVLEHVTEPRWFVEKIGRWLKPGGLVHLDVPNQHSLSAWAHRAFKSSNRWGAVEWPHHVFAYSRRSLERLLSLEFDCRVLARPCDDRTWGQAYEPHALRRLYYRASALVGAPSILVAIGSKRATA